MTAQLTRQLQTAATHFHAGRLADAESICRSILRSSPGFLDAKHLLALARRKQEDLADAEGLFRACLRQAPERADIRANFGNLLKSRGAYSEAIAEYREALVHEPEFRPARIALARTLIEAGQFGAAIGEAEQLLEDDPDDAEALAAIGAAQQGLLDDDASEAAYRRAIAASPRYGAALHNLGALLAKQGRYEEAVEQLMSAARAGVTGPEIAHNLASSLAGLEQFDEAVAFLTRATEAMPQAIELHRLLARLRYMRGDADFAGSLRAVGDNLPGYVPLHVAHAQILRAAGDLEAAYALLQPLQANPVERALIDAELAAIHQEAGRYDEALQCALRLTETPTSYGPHFDLLIDALMSLGRADEAMSYITTARAAAPLNQWYVAMEATAARLLGDPRYAELYDYDRFVQTYRLEAPRGWSSIEAFQNDLNAVLIERHSFRAQPLDQSLRNGTQTPRSLLADSHPAIAGFLQAIQAPIEAYRRHIGSNPDHPMTARNNGDVKLAGCWSVRLKQHGFHVNHVHPEGWISSAYYAEVPDEVNDTEKKSGWIQFGEPRFPVPGATAEKFVQPQAGSLVLFPSYMWHGTTPIHGDAPRMTIAFDAVCLPGAQHDH